MPRSYAAYSINKEAVDEHADEGNRLLNGISENSVLVDLRKLIERQQRASIIIPTASLMFLYCHMI